MCVQQKYEGWKMGIGHTYVKAPEFLSVLQPKYRREP